MVPNESVRFIGLIKFKFKNILSQKFQTKKNMKEPYPNNQGQPQSTVSYGAAPAVILQPTFVGVPHLTSTPQHMSKCVI